MRTRPPSTTSAIRGYWFRAKLKQTDSAGKSLTGLTNGLSHCYVELFCGLTDTMVNLPNCFLITHEVSWHKTMNNIMIKFCSGLSKNYWETCK